MEQAHAGDGSCARELEQQLRELRCRTQQQEQCIEQYKMETQKMMALSQGAASADSAQGMMKVWLRDARQQSDDLRFPIATNPLARAARPRSSLCATGSRCSVSARTRANADDADSSSLPAARLGADAFLTRARSLRRRRLQPRSVNWAPRSAGSSNRSLRLKPTLQKQPKREQGQRRWRSDCVMN